MTPHAPPRRPPRRPPPRRPLPWAVLALAAAALLLVAAPAAAELHVKLTSYRNQYEATNSDKGVGYARLEVHNPTGRPEDFVVTMRDDQGNRYSLEGTGLRPGETRILHVPTLRPAFSVQVADAAGYETTGTVYPATAEVGALHIYTTGTKATLAKEEALREEIRRLRGNMMNDVSGRSYPSYYYGRTGTSAGAPLWETEAGMAPDDWRCYLAFPLVFVSRDVLASIDDQPSGLALREWVRTGGTLFIYDADRSLTRSDGAGTIIETDLNLFEDPTEAVELLPQGLVRHGWRSFHRDWGDAYRRSGRRMYGATTTFPVKVESTTAYSVPVTLSVLFFIVAGPLNYFWLKRRGHVKLLFVTVPVIAAFFCGMITVAFLLTQGFDRRSALVSFSFVDQQEEWGFVSARQLFYSGLYPGGGFRWTGKSFFLPLAMNDGATYDLSAGVHITGGQFRPLSEMHYVTYRPQKTRERLDIETNADGTLAVANGFETDIDMLLVRRGDAFYEARDLRKGDRGGLRQLDISGQAGPFLSPWRHLGADEELLATLTSLVDPFAPKEPFEATERTVYYARFVTRPREVEPGVERATDVGSWHFLAGAI